MQFLEAYSLDCGYECCLRVSATLFLSWDGHNYGYRGHTVHATLRPAIGCVTAKHDLRMGNNFESLGCGALSGLIRGSTDSHHRRMESGRNPYQQWRMDMLPHRRHSRFVIRVCFVRNVW